MTCSGWKMTAVVAAGVLATGLAAGQAVAQGKPAPRKAKAERSQVVNELGRLQQAQLALFRRYAADDDFAGRLDDLMAKRDFRGAAAAVAEISGMAAQSVEVSGGAAVGADGAGALGVDPSVLGVWDAPSLRQLRGPNAAASAEAAMATSGHVCFNLVIVKGCIDW